MAKTAPPPKVERKPKKRRKAGKQRRSRSGLYEAESMVESGGNLTKAEKSRRAVFRGFLRYVQRTGATVREIWETERISDDEDAPFIREVVTLSAFKAQTHRGQWRKRRDEHWKEVRQKVLDHAQTEAVKAEIDEIEMLEAVRTLVLDRITGNRAAGIPPAMPKSLEGAVGAFVQIDKRVAQKREIVVVQTAEAATRARTDQPGLHGGGTAPMIAMNDDNPLTDAEIEAMSKTLARERAGIVEVDEEDRVLPQNILKPLDEDGNEVEE